jgi:hypothetical protein
MKKYLLAVLAAIFVLGLTACGADPEPEASAKAAKATPEPTPDVAELKYDVGIKLAALMQDPAFTSDDIDTSCARIDKVTTLYEDYSGAVDKLLEVRPNADLGEDRDELKTLFEDLTENCALVNGINEGGGTTEPASKPEPEMTSSQKNAIGSARDYLEYSAFSKSELIDQLEYEKFSKADSRFAVNHITVNWNAQAVKSAKEYLDYSSFSKAELIDQLEYEGFTAAQARYGVDQAY